MNVRLTLALVFVLALKLKPASDKPPSFEDFPVTQVFTWKPVTPKLQTTVARRYRTEITEGIEKAARRSKSEGLEQEGQGPNFGGNMIVVQWSTRAPGMEMAVVAAETGEIYFPPISFHGIGAASFDLPLLTPGKGMLDAVD